MKTKKLQDNLVNTMKNWQKVEKASVSSTSEIINKSENPIIEMIMEIILHDSQLHFRVQDLIIRSLEQTALVLPTEDLQAIWSQVEKHIEIEKHTIELAEEALNALKGKKMVVQEYLLRYLLQDEKKHNILLEDLSVIKKGMYPYG